MVVAFVCGSSSVSPTANVLTVLIFSFKTISGSSSSLEIVLLNSATLSCDSGTTSLEPESAEFKFALNVRAEDIVSVITFSRDGFRCFQVV